MYTKKNSPMRKQAVIKSRKKHYAYSTIMLTGLQ